MHLHISVNVGVVTNIPHDTTFALMILLILSFTRVLCIMYYVVKPLRITVCALVGPCKGVPARDSGFKFQWTVDSGFRLVYCIFLKYSTPSFKPLFWDSFFKHADILN